MTIKAMKAALEAMRFGLHVGFDESSESQIKKGGKAFDQHSNAITALRTAIAEAEKQEAWKTSDTAYRPDGLPQDFIKHEVDSFADWSEWVCPDPTQYFMKCCDCGLVHEMQFNVVKYSERDKCEDFNDPNVQVFFRARRATPPAAQRQPQYNKTEMNCFVQNLYDQKMREGKRGHYETMFHVVHRAIEAAHGIKGEKK
jgi:hypothetical protein